MENLEDTPEKKLLQAQGKRATADTTMNEVVRSAVKAAEELCAELARERDQAQQMLLVAEKAKAEAETYYQQQVAESRKQAQQIMAAANETKAQADAYYERITAEAQRVIAEAENAKSQAEAYCEELIAAARERSVSLISQAVLAAREKTNDIDLAHSLENSRGPAWRYTEENLVGQAKPAQILEHISPQTTGLQPTATRELDMEELVLGVDLEQGSKAFPLVALTKTAIINDAIAGHAVLLTYEPSLEAGIAFSREVDDGTLSFSPVASEGGEATLMTDRETGTLWEILIGRAVKGPLAGKSLTRVHSEHAVWSAWREQHPNTWVYQLAN